jgi:hypothetical protein
VLCCAVLCCAVLCCAVLCCAVLCCAVLCCAVLHCPFVLIRDYLLAQVVSDLNQGYRVCESYPETLVVPRCLDAQTLLDAALFRSQNRLPVLSYAHKKRSNALMRHAFWNMLQLSLCLSLT